jgi:predicted metal-dependent hydrolase
MLNKHYEMLGDAVRRARNEVLSSEELGKLIMQYVELLQQEAMRDERDIINGKGV